MNSKQIGIFAGVGVVAAVALVVAIRQNPTSTKDGSGTIAVPQPMATTNEINPFTHVVAIPATVDPATIRFEKLKMVELATKTKVTTDEQKCKELQFRDPDGSGCQSVSVLEKVKAVEARYSYNGPELGSGEAAPGRDTFSVYFRPEEVGIDGEVSKLKREQAEALFQVNTSRPMTEVKVVDKQNSHFCEGKYVDGNWVNNDASCKDDVKTISQMAPSANWTVQVELRHPAMASR
jgi:hypothetical protein